MGLTLPLTHLLTRSRSFARLDRLGVAFRDVLGAELDPADGRPCRGADGDKGRAFSADGGRCRQRGGKHGGRGDSGPQYSPLFLMHCYGPVPVDRAIFAQSL